MSLSLQVLYPTDNNSTFDLNYYTTKHMEIVANYIGAHIERTLITKGIAGGADSPPGFHAVATLEFADKGALDDAMAASGPVLADIPNFYNGQPQMLIGEVIG